MASSDSLTRKRSLSPRARIVKISIVCQVQSPVLVKLKGHLPIKMAVDAYFKKTSLERSGVELLYNGQRLNMKLSPDQLGMEDEDTIEVMTISNGGGI